MRERIGASFDRAVDVLLACRGKVVVTGVGKSGIVGRKIAATFASTGTPALFLHASEGSHGDLGVLAARRRAGRARRTAARPRRCCACSRSRSAWASRSSRSRGAPASSLARAADVTLDVSVPEEACPLGLAPTASTTATMALGDALAVALFEERGFTADDFALLHPGGALGRRLLRVEDLMRRGDALPRVRDGASLEDTRRQRSARKRLGMTDGGGRRRRPRRRHHRRRPAPRRSSAPPTSARSLPRDLMTAQRRRPSPAPRSRRRPWRSWSAIAITSLIVLEDGTRRPVGVIHLHDVLRAGVV